MAVYAAHKEVKIYNLNYGFDYWNGGLCSIMRFVTVNAGNSFGTAVDGKEIKVEFPVRTDNSYEDDMADIDLELSSNRTSFQSECIEALNF